MVIQLDGDYFLAINSFSYAMVIFSALSILSLHSLKLTAPAFRTTNLTPPANLEQWERLQYFIKFTFFPLICSLQNELTRDMNKSRLKTPIIKFSTFDLIQNTKRLRCGILVRYSQKMLQPAKLT